ncbi:DUF397 domain-containing protein [Streptomyces sp. NBC_00878]|uniref:DUF397 domain-containing protein n=1 Tax=Streptomyces sp. NBC_00878 TaxID=2975854 RepID=UPI00224EFB57|nr:DUF397 domain-containing protein [Streptomyces sp. NBC_00878]MCX4908670.1 DUF397 domain-containing protein [Streptomyces sp. NBC_00878]
MSAHLTAPQITPEIAWRKSSYSDGMGNNCVEVAHLTTAPAIAVRDSKNAAGPALLVPSTAWTTFVTHIRETVSSD